MAASHRDERRRHPRIYVPFTADVQGFGEGGEPFRCLTVLDDLSAGGFRLRIMQRPEENSELTVESRLSLEGNRGALLVIKGRVLRIEPKGGGVYGVALKIKNHKFR